MLGVPSILRAAAMLWGAGAIAWALRGEVRRRRRGIAACGVALAAWLGVNVGIVAGAPAANVAGWLVERDAIGSGPVDAVFVFSGDTGARTAWAARVWRETGARWFVTGGAGAGGDSGAWIAARAIAAGVPASALVVEERSTTTRENVTFAAPAVVARGIRRIVLVTSPFHSRRAAMAARIAWPGVEVISDPVPLEDDECGAAPMGTSACRGRVGSEWEKLAGYFVAGWI